jgi:hypothetical protein
VSRREYLLPCRPKPGPTESLINHVLRLSEMNGYVNPQSVLDRAGMQVNTSRAIDVLKLHAITGWGEELKKIAYSSTPGDLANSQLLGQIVSTMDICLNRVRLCVECVQELRFVQAHFDLGVMVACPVHRKKTLTHCGTCGKSLKVYRPGLLICKCGAALANENPQGVLDREVQLLDIVRRKTLSLSIPSENISGFPPELKSLDLRTILAVISVLGKHLRVQHISEADDEMAIRISLAAEALSEWPNRFFQMIDHFEEGFSEHNPATFGKGRMRNLYLALLRPNVPFIFSAFSEYANRNYGEGCRSRLAGLTNGKNSPMYLSKRQLGKQFGISREAINRIIELNAVKVVNASHGKSKRVYIDAREIESERTEISCLCNSEQAARIIGIQPRILLCLRQLGLSHPRSQSAKPKKFDLPAVREFARRFDPFLEIRGKGCSGMIRLDRLMDSVGITLHVKAMVIDFILARRLYAGSEDGSVAGILISEKLVLEARAREQSIVMQNGSICAGRLEGNDELPVTADEAAREVECSTQALYILVSRGVLRGRKCKSTLWITRESLASFVAQNVSILFLARRIGTSTRTLMAYCSRKKIDILIVRCGIEKRRQGFVRKTAVAEILKGAKTELGMCSVRKVLRKAA